MRFLVSLPTVLFGGLSLNSDTNTPIEIDFKQHRWTSGKTRLRFRPLDDALISISKAKPPTCYLEIGVREGGSLLAVLEHSVPPPRLLVLCDTWQGVGGGTGRGNHDHISELLEERRFQGEVRFLDGKSQELIPTIEDMWFDLILVDGDHRPGPALEDLENSWPLLQSGGHLVFDDTNNGNLSKLAQKWGDRPDCRILWRSREGPGTTVFLRKEDPCETTPSS